MKGATYENKNVINRQWIRYMCSHLDGIYSLNVRWVTFSFIANPLKNANNNITNLFSGFAQDGDQVRNFTVQ
jgi:hypothetical protein